MNEPDWQLLGEIAAGDVWAGLAEHASIAGLDKTHLSPRASIGLWLSASRNGSRGSFLCKKWRAGHVPLGSIVVVPGGVPLHVTADVLPRRRMLHCRLPERVSVHADATPLDACLDVHSEAIATSLARLAREVIDPGFGSTAIVEGLGLVIAGELARVLAGAPVRRQKGGLAPWQLRRIDDWLQAGNWNSGISELADLCGISPGHAMRAFRQSTGRSLAGHIATLRAERACMLLRETPQSIAQIGSDLGFGSPSAFGAAFRRAMGMTPSDYRQRLR